VQDESSRRSTGRSDSQSTNSQPAIAAASLLTTLLMTLLMTSIACSITTAAAACPVGDPPTASDAPPAATAAATTPSETTPPAGPLAPRNFISSEQLQDRIIALANAAPTRSTVTQIGVSRDGLPIQVVTLGDPDLTRKRPEVLLIGGMDAVNLGSPEQAFTAAMQLVREHPTMLDEVRVHVILCANPDARTMALQTGLPRATNTRRIDHDRDGKIDEDSPEDFNGDGVITLMRRVAPPGSVATHIVDAANPRIVRSANRDKSEVATHQTMLEGRDLDGDGLVGEDPVTGVDLDRNFPHRWPEFDLDAGPFPLSEPETIAIAKFVRDHPAIVSALIFGRHDTLAEFPDTKDKDSTNRTPMVYLEADHALYRELSKAWRETTKLEKSNNADLAGSLVLWLANHRGIAAVAANGWTRPDVPAVPEGSPAPATIATGDDEQQAWIDLCYRLYESPGFVEWTRNQHPKFGAVEVGGFMPFLRESPTASQAEVLAKKSAPFLKTLADKLPEINVSEISMTDLGGGLARIGLRITNRGDFPTTTEMGRITGVVPPIVVRVGVAPNDVLAGRAVEKIDRLAAHEARDFEWTVRMPPDGRLSLTVRGAFFDDIVREARPAGEAANATTSTRALSTSSNSTVHTSNSPVSASKEVTP
jgi:hypothetical protein